LKLVKSQNKKFLLEDIRNKIESNELKPGEKLLSTKELAGKYGIAIQTAQRLLTELVDEGLLMRKKGVGTIIREKKHNSSGVVGLIMPCHGDIWAEFTATIVSGLQEHNINTILIDADSSRHSMINMQNHPTVKQLIASNPLGIIVYDTELGNYLADNNPDVKIICISGENIDSMTKMDFIAPDLFHAGYMMAEHFIKSGHKHISFYKIKPPEQTISSKRRELIPICDGYKKALTDAGLKIDVFVDSTDAANDMKMFYDRLKSREKMDALYVNFDLRASQFLQKAEAKGINIPNDLAIISGYNTPWAESFQLTSIDFHYELIAKKCIEVIIEYIKQDKVKNSKQIIKFKPELIIRKSCGCNT